jgi:hypothetical protein
LAISSSYSGFTKSFHDKETIEKLLRYHVPIEGMKRPSGATTIPSIALMPTTGTETVSRAIETIQKQAHDSAKVYDFVAALNAKKRIAAISKRFG